MSEESVDSEFSWDAITPERVPDFKASEEPKPTIGEKVKSYANKRAERKPTTTRRKPAKKTSAPKKGAYVEDLQALYTYAGMGLMMVDTVCATAVVESAENCAKAIDELAYQNESVRRVLDTLTQGSAISSVVIAHLPILMAVASHHSLLPFAKDSTTEPIVEDATIPAA